MDQLCATQTRAGATTAACAKSPPLLVAQETGPPTPLLDTVNYPVHLKNLGLGDLKKLCKELRAGGRRAGARAAPGGALA